MQSGLRNTKDGKKKNLMRTAAATAATAATAAGCYLVYRHRQSLRQSLRQLVLPPPVAPPPAEDEDMCAICIERPVEAVKTQCNHRFCLACFRSWASRQDPPQSTARCPLCTTAVVRLTPEAWPQATAEALERTRWLVGYNLEAALTVKLAWASRALEAVRAITGGFAIGLYVLSGHAWEQAHESMRFSFAVRIIPASAPASVVLPCIPAIGRARWRWQSFLAKFTFSAYHWYRHQPRIPTFILATDRNTTVTIKAYLR